MTKSIAKFTSADKSQTLTIVAAQGKKGFNVKASVKTGSGKGAPKAVTGGRGSFDTADKAGAAFNKLKAEAVKVGWTEVKISAKNAFTSIPAPVAVPEKTAKASAAKN